MKKAAARALAELAREPVPGYVKEIYGAPDLAFGRDYIIPKPFDRRLFETVPAAVAEAAVASGAAKPGFKPADYRAELRERNAKRRLGG